MHSAITPSCLEQLGYRPGSSFSLVRGETGAQRLGIAAEVATLFLKNFHPHPKCHPFCRSGDRDISGPWGGTSLGGYLVPYPIFAAFAVSAEGRAPDQAKLVSAPGLGRGCGWQGSILGIFRLVLRVDQRLSTCRGLVLQVNHRGQVPTDDRGWPLRCASTPVICPAPFVFGPCRSFSDPLPLSSRAIR